MEYEDESQGKYPKLYQLDSGTEFMIAGAGDVITIQRENEEPQEVLNKFTLVRIDGMYSICLDLELNIHHLGATTKVIPYA